MPKTLEVQRYPAQYADVLIHVASTGQPVRIPNATESAAKTLRGKFYGFIRAVEKELTKEAAAKQRGVKLEDSYVARLALSKEIIAELTIRLEGSELVVLKKDQTDEAQRIRAALEASRGAVPQEVKGGNNDAPSIDDFLRRLNSGV